MDKTQILQEYREIVNSITKKPGIIPKGVVTVSSYNEWYRHFLNTMVGHVDNLRVMDYEDEATALEQMVGEAKGSNPSAEEYRQKIIDENRRARGEFR
jgi:hypothetical protein